MQTTAEDAITQQITTQATTIQQTIQQTTQQTIQQTIQQITAQTVDNLLHPNRTNRLKGKKVIRRTNILLMTFSF